MSKKRKDTPNGSSSRVLIEVRGLADHTTSTLAKVGRGGFRGLTDDELFAVVVALGDSTRGIDALLIEATAEIQRRETNTEPFHRVHGCASVNEFLQRTTGMSGATAKRFISAADAVQGGLSLHGELLAARFPAVAEAMFAGRLGVDGVLAATRDLAEVRHRVEPAVFDETERVMVDVITTTLSLDGYAPMADDIRRFARGVATRLDQDGPKPVENEARRGRYVKLGPMRNGLVPIHGLLTPEVAARLRTAYDAMHNPRVTFNDPDDDTPLMERDDRTTGQKWHDTLATVTNVATASKELPTLGGAQATLVVHVEEETLLAGEGWAHIDGEPVPIETALHAGCAGVIQRVAMTRDGRVTRIGTEERVFNRHQRRAIAARDGHCVIPGCTVSAAWCEVHHVIPWRQGGKTTTDNGVLLCWYHHRYIDDGVWQLKFISGVPHVKSNRWGSQWRPTTPIRQRT